MTSRLRPGDGPRHAWTPEPGVTVDLPVVLDFVIAPVDGGPAYSVTEATVDLCDGEPALVRLVATCPAGMDLVWTQRMFRWAGPVEVVTRMVPALIRAGLDPYTAEFPVDDLPAATRRAPQRRLSDEFLEDVASEYLTHGRGYARAMAAHYQVSQRTVVSWIEKARERGILTATEPGRFGGHVRPRGRRDG
jgi:hypothetical protein